MAAQPLPRVAIVIDDVGGSFEAVEPFVALPLALSFAVLPFLDRAPEVARDLAALGRDVLVHVPMEPCDPATIDGPGFLRAGMDEPTLAATLARHLDRVPGALGANNHMGSRLTTDRDAMRVVLGVLAQRNLFVLDSRTSADTVLLAVAAEAGVPAIRRHVFLDDDPSPTTVRAQVDELLRIAKAQGCAVAVGHPRPTTYDALRELASRPDPGVRFVPVSRLINDPCGRLDPPPKGHSGR
jgi:polysaccharide deacetylase 2 family uncharacterized protein YibQ